MNEDNLPIDLPEEWQELTVGELAAIYDGSVPNGSTHLLSSAGAELWLSPAGSVMVAVQSDLLTQRIVVVANGQSVAAPSSVLPEYFVYCLTGPGRDAIELQPISAAASQRVFIPPLAKQREIVADIRRRERDLQDALDDASACLSLSAGGQEEEPDKELLRQEWVDHLAKPSIELVLRSFLQQWPRLVGEDGALAREKVSQLATLLAGLEARLTERVEDGFAGLRQAAEASSVAATTHAELSPVPLQPEAFASVKDILIREGIASFQLVAEGHPPVSIDGKPLYPMFMTFVMRASRDAPGEVVPWAELNQCVDRTNTANTSSDLTRGFLLDLRAKLKHLGTPPDGEDWLVTRRGKGCHLNESCKWTVDPKVRAVYGRLSQSVDGRWTDPQDIDENTPANGFKLPQQRRRPKHRSKYEEDENE